MMQMVYLTAFYKYRVLPGMLVFGALPGLTLTFLGIDTHILPEGGNAAGLNVYYLSRAAAKALLEQLGYKLCGLTGFNKLSAYKPGHLFVGKRGAPREPGVLFV